MVRHVNQLFQQKKILAKVIENVNLGQIIKLISCFFCEILPKEKSSVK